MFVNKSLNRLDLTIPTLLTVDGKKLRLKNLKSGLSNKFREYKDKDNLPIVMGVGIVTTREMTPQEERFWRHALTNDKVAMSYLKNQAIHGQNIAKHAKSLPISPCCESVALYHQGGIMCGKCGKWSPKAASHKLREHIRQGLYR